MKLLLDECLPVDFRRHLRGHEVRSAEWAGFKGLKNGKLLREATILVGGDPSSATYVRMKGNACRRVGLASLPITLPETASTDDVLTAVKTLNADPRVYGILLQHPVPRQVDERLCFDTIELRKDVDGVTTLGYGRMALGEPAFNAATPGGILTMLKHYGIALEGKEAVVFGRSPILGKPMAAMLVNANATVTICRSRTHDLESVVTRADVVIAAVGKPEFIKARWIKDGAVVVDAGYHPPGVGDIELPGVIGRCAAYTPVPGGMGPMTIATLITQTVQAARNGSWASRQPGSCLIAQRLPTLLIICRRLWSVGGMSFPQYPRRVSPKIHPGDHEAISV